MFTRKFCIGSDGVKKRVLEHTHGQVSSIFGYILDQGDNGGTGVEDEEKKPNWGTTKS